MIKSLFNKIKEYNTIIIHRHTRPDLDALGSQIGLAKTLKYNYPEKNIYIVGDKTQKYDFIGQMDEITDDLYSNALVIIVDVAVSYMISDERYKFAKEVYVIDHHKNSCDVSLNHIVDTTKVAAGEFITELLLENGLNIPSDAATCFYGAMITDSGRFMYGENLSQTFITASKLIALGANPKYIYDNIYVETLKDRQMKNYFSNKFIVKGHVAYLKNDADVFEKFNCEFNDVSRGMLSVMSGIKEIEIWLNFTYDTTKQAIIGEFRSRSISIVDIAKKYGGGGHELACGATISDWNMVDKVIEDFAQRAGGSF